MIHAHGNIRALAVNGSHDGAGLAIKAVLRPVVADPADGIPGNSGNIYIAGGRDLSHDKHHTRGGNGFAGHPSLGILGQDGVKNSIRDLVADFVRMTFRDGFRCKNTFWHNKNLLSLRFRKKTAPHRRSVFAYREPHLSICTAGFGTLHMQVAGLHRADPSTALNKGLFNSKTYYIT